MRRVGAALIPGEIKKNIFRDQKNINGKKTKRTVGLQMRMLCLLGEKVGGGFGRRAHRLSPKAASPIDTATSTQQKTRGFAASPIDTATSTQQMTRGVAVSFIDTATSTHQKTQGFAASPIDTATST